MGKNVNDREVVLKLARVVIALAWTDGDLSNEELNCLKDLIFRLRTSGFDEVMQLNAQEWARLEMYIETPVSEQERERLIVDLQNAISSPGQKQLALDALKRMVESDGLISEDEESALAEVQAAIESVALGGLHGLNRLFGGAMQRRAAAAANAPNREDFFDDFIKNKVYYDVQQRLLTDGLTMEISEADLRKLSLVGGLMAKIAQIDRVVNSGELESIRRAFQEYWSVDAATATFVSEVAVSAVDVAYDTFRMMRELTAVTSDAERNQVLNILFAVANADGKLSLDETEEIRLVALSLGLSHQEFIAAKLHALGES